MKTKILIVSLMVLGSACSFAHLTGDPAHDGLVSHYDPNVTPPTNIVLHLSSSLANTTNRGASVAAAFAPFAPKVKTHWDDSFFYIESDGLPAHNLMVGITAWQQQVPLPQKYSGDNAWRFPLNPVPAAQPQTIKNHFLRGAIAIAANGIPIFNPQNNRGEISNEIGELDQWGGHCGRADDYHYHAAPLHLQDVAGKGAPIAYALDGYPMFGLTEPDGSAPAKLDSFNGHESAAIGYHYHGSTKYPYVNGGFHGEVVERDGQVDPQPRAQPLREASAPLRGARITGFTAKDKSCSLKYDISGETRFVNYVVNDNGTVKFDFVDGRGQVRSETYSQRPGGGDRPPGEPKGKDGKKKGPGNGPPPTPERDAKSGTPPLILNAKRSGNLLLSSPVVKDGGVLPTEFTGDGAGSSPPLEWKGAPAGTKWFAIVMDHLAPGNEMKCYWTMWDIPANVTSLPKNSREVGKLGAGFKGAPGYEPPHSQGPGLKAYTIHLFALSAPPQLDRPQREVTRDVLLTAIKDSILDSADLKVTYTKPGGNGIRPKAK